LDTHTHTDIYTHSHTHTQTHLFCYQRRISSGDAYVWKAIKVSGDQAARTVV